MDERVNNPENLEREAFIHNLEAGVRRVFPEFSVMDRKEHDTYDPANDPNERGPIIKFYTQRGQGPEDPILYVVPWPKGYGVTTANWPNPPEIRPIQNPNSDSVHGHIVGMTQTMWQPGDIDLALEKTKIRYEGIDPNSEEFLNQLAGWSEEEQRFLTMRDRMARSKEYMSKLRKKQNELKKQKGKKYGTVANAQRELSPEFVWDLYERNPDKARELVLQRIAAAGNYQTSDGRIVSSAAVCEEIRQGTVTGRKELERELNVIESYESLLWDERLL